MKKSEFPQSRVLSYAVAAFIGAYLLGLADQISQPQQTASASVSAGASAGAAACPSRTAAPDGHSNTIAKLDALTEYGAGEWGCL